MSSRYSAARPKRAGEAYARSQQQENEASESPTAGPSKKVKFDVRNPSTLAPDAPEEDAVLEADVIGKGHGATKRGAVNIEGYDSDSDNENFDVRARQRKKGDVNILKQLDNYDAKGGAAPPAPVNEDDEDEDMFAPEENEKDETEGTVDGDAAGGKKNKSVSFMDPQAIQGAEDGSKSGGIVHVDSEESDTDDEKTDEVMAEQGLDEEIGLGGLKHRAPKLEAFNMKEEQEEGRFDEDGNYLRKAIDPDSVHDQWLEGLSKKDMRKAADAHEKRQAEQRKARLEDDCMITADLLTKLIVNLEKGETPLEALARLGKSQKKKAKEKKVPKWKLKKQKPSMESMDVDEAKQEEDPEQVRVKEAIDAVTESADRLMGRGRPDIYDRERELLIREYRKETDEDWVEPKQAKKDPSGAPPPIDPKAMWEYRWTDGRDGGQQQGPYDGATMKAWQDAGYFSDGIEFRPVGNSGDWRRVVSFV
ncbi:LIN1-like protein [Zalerion maritima]|uniref:LIN1-like protein n=1 Tax=Zalerion maritima TaxID=339359 RepID=A0AAD5RJY8_9PEZI|nr:LIN1-like protein [Zalerion maritima]